MAQRYLTDIDSSFFIKDTVRPVIKRLENIRISGYIQPQFQIASSNGAPTFEGGNFSTYSNSRFMLRRARLKFDYMLPSRKNTPLALFTFQFDATERGVLVRDMFLKFFETSKRNFSFNAGLFARPYGYEVNLSSSVRETPERGRMSQILMPSERDLGFMVSYTPTAKKLRARNFKWDAGFFNGQGLSGSTDFDSHKDFISRVSLLPVKSKKLEIGIGASLLEGGWRNATKYLYSMDKGSNRFTVDSTLENLSTVARRNYYGLDAQINWLHVHTETELRAEYWWGLQPGTASSTANPGTLQVLPTYMRHFNGAFIYFLQHIVNKNNQLIIKYDWYDPNSRIAGKNIGTLGNNTSWADIRFHTAGIGYAHHFNDQLKIIIYYDIVQNEHSNILGFQGDTKDNVLTCRMQLRF